MTGQKQPDRSQRILDWQLSAGWQDREYCVNPSVHLRPLHYGRSLMLKEKDYLVLSPLPGVLLVCSLGVQFVVDVSDCLPLEKIYLLSP